LARNTFGLPNYLVLALAAAFLIALIPVGARRAIHSNANRVEDWLPNTFTESSNLRWFRDHFTGEQFALVSWDGCTLANTEKLDQLARKLAPSQDAISTAAENSDLRQRARWYNQVVSGPSVLAQLTAAPLSLSYAEAASRLEGALVGPVRRDAQGRSLGDQTRTTCLVVYLSAEATQDNKTMRQAVEKITDIAANECAIPRETIHMGGPPVENIAIDTEATHTIVQLSGCAGLFGFGLAFICFRSFKIAALVFAVGVLSAGLSLAVVFYFGVAEIALLNLGEPHLGKIDAILMSMPAVVYVLGLAGAIHFINYYLDARRDQGPTAAVETAVRSCWWPSLLASLATALGLSTLIASDILPIQKFGLFTTVAVLAMVLVLFSILPVVLFRFPLDDRKIQHSSSSNLPDWLLDLFGFVVGRHALVNVICVIVTAIFAVGFTRIGTSVQLLKLFSPKTDIIQDYAWLEENLGNLVPMEVLVTVPPERIRTADEHAEQDGKQYRMTMLERLDMIREIQFRVEALPEVSRAMSAATFAPTNTDTGISIAADRSNDYSINKGIEEQRALLLTGDYLRKERLADTYSESGRELWRVSARVEALANPKGRVKEIDYGQFVEQLKSAVDPVLVAYQQRDIIIEQLHKQGKKLDGAQICILYRTPDAAPEPILNSQESVLANLLLKSGVRPRTLPDGQRLRGVTFFNLTPFDTQMEEPQYLHRAVQALGAQDALILVSAGSDPTAKKLADGGFNMIDVTHVEVSKLSAAVDVQKSVEPRPIGSVYTGVVPVVYKTQRQLLQTLNYSVFWASVGVTGVMIIVLRSAVAGLTAMIPNMFPFVVIFGTLGWLGIKVDIGIMLSASIALALALSHTIHYLTWFRRGTALGLNRIEAVMFAYDRCAPAMLQTAIIGGLGLAVFGLSGFTPTQQFGFLMVGTLAVALVGDLILLPALLAGPLGYYFGGKESVTDTTALAVPGAFAVATQRVLKKLRLTTDSELPSISETATPVFVDVPAEPAPTAAFAARIAPATEQRTDVIDGAHADLHARLRNLRRETSPKRHPS
jgi:predicted RND superfamily exporter protein